MIFFLLFFSQIFQWESPSIHVKITNIEEVKGEMYIAIYNESDDFPNDGQWSFRTSKEVSEAFLEFQVEDLEIGTYAVAIFHDVNGNGEMDENWMGIPKEPFAFSNNFKPKFSAPKFEDCQFELTAEGANLEIALIHKIF